MQLSPLSSIEPMPVRRLGASRSKPAPPAIVLGGGANALSVVRSLGRAGISAYVLNDRSAQVRHSRYAHGIELPSTTPPEEAWTTFLLGPASDYLRGAVLLNCCDPGIETLARYRAELANKFILEEANPDIQLCMLNKLSTYEKAVAAGIPTPRFWLARTMTEVRGLRRDLIFPLIVKPLYSHVYQQRFGKKFEIAHDYDELLPAFDKAVGCEIEVMLVEMIQGGDDRLCSYYTYLDENGTPLFHFTKRVIRRCPPIMGNGCYHITDWDPEVRDLGLKFFQAVGMRGLANVEFKRDERDGQLKLIECNARFTAANCLVADSGLDLALFVYNRLTGCPQPPLGDYRKGLRLWNPVEDFHAFRKLRKQGQLSWRQWLASIAHRQTVPYFRWCDPWPSVVKAFEGIAGALGRRLR